MTELYLPKQEASNYFHKLGISLDEGIANLNKLLATKILIKIGGDCLNNGGYNSIGQSLADLYALGIVPTILHGGGSQIDRVMEEKELPIIKVNGLRAVPDKPTLDAVVEGLEEVNNGLVSAINEYVGSNVAVGLMQEQVVHSKKHPSGINKKTGEFVDLGFVGEVTGVNFGEIDYYTKKGKIPVLWCIGYGDDGQQYNVNADVVGEALAPNFGKYILLTSVGGYIEKSEIVTELTLEQAKKHNATGGMSIKLDSITWLLENTDLESVQITSPENLPFELLLDEGRGTIIRK